MLVLFMYHHSIFPNEQNPSSDDHISPKHGLDPIQPMPPEVGYIQLATHTVKFPKPEVDHCIEEKPTGGLNCLWGVEMCREMREECELSQAGYIHLREPKTVAADKDNQEDTDKVNIKEQKDPFHDLENSLNTSFNTKDPVQSRGLELTKVEEKRHRHGKTMLTPTKKSAFRKASPCPPSFIW